MKETRTGSITLILAEEEVYKGGEEIISNLPKRDESEFIVIDEKPGVEEGVIYVNGLYFSVFYCLCFTK